MSIRKWFVVWHINGEYTVEDVETGDGMVLDVPFDRYSEQQAKLVCAAANAAVEIERTVPFGK